MLKICKAVTALEQVYEMPTPIPLMKVIKLGSLKASLFSDVRTYFNRKWGFFLNLAYEQALALSLIFLPGAPQRAC